MRTFLLKQMELISKNAVAKVMTLGLNASRFPYKVLTIALSVAMMPVAYAEQPLSDAELDNKYIEVKIIPICTTDKADQKVDQKDKGESSDTKAGSAAPQQTCHDANYFVAVLTNKQVDLTAADANAAQSKDSNAATLLASVFDNIRLLGGSDILGVPAGVANSGVPLLFGNENYSYTWAGNLGQIFQVAGYGINGSGSEYYNSVYDTSSLGYGFRYEAHFPYGPPPPPTIQIFTSSHN